MQLTQQDLLVIAQALQDASKAMNDDPKATLTIQLAQAKIDRMLSESDDTYYCLILHNIGVVETLHGVLKIANNSIEDYGETAVGQDALCKQIIGQLCDMHDGPKRKLCTTELPSNCRNVSTDQGLGWFDGNVWRQADVKKQLLPAPIWWIDVSDML